MPLPTLPTLHRVIQALGLPTPSTLTRTTTTKKQKAIDTIMFKTKTDSPAPAAPKTWAENPGEMSAAEKAHRDAAFNTRPDAVINAPEPTSTWEQFAQWQGNVLARLGLDSLSGEVAADNPTLIAALATIAAAGAPEPIRHTETVAYPGGGYTLGVYVYAHPTIPAVTHRASEILLAANPAIVVAELRGLGIIPAA